MATAGGCDSNAPKGAGTDAGPGGDNPALDSDDPGNDTGQPPDQPDPDEGTSDFISADGRAGEETGTNDFGAAGGEPAAESDSDDGGGGARTVEEGDIYRVLSSNTLLNLNSYRGLQVVDISNLNQPKIIGKLQVSGHPVEMYVVDNTAYLLINNWRAYYGSRDDIEIETYEGGIVVAVDLSDKTDPQILDIAQVPGSIQTSRLIGNEVKRALYVAAGNWNRTSTTVVRSFALPADGSVVEKTTLDLGGYVQDIQATSEALLVARFDYETYDEGSTVAVIDVSDPDGTMVEGSEIQTKGRINSKTNMNLYKNVLRLVSGASWGGTNTNHLETFNVADINNPIVVDHKTFGDGEQLYATLFLGNKAFFVTYFVTDPFHAFEIDDLGNAQEKAEYIISGWNDYFKPVINNTRLIGIGKNDEGGGRTMAVSLYDITDLSNKKPFLGREKVSADSTWSEASWDDRAFSVLQNVVSVEAEDGTVETGLVLLPYNGYNHTTREQIAAVQIFTFSNSTLTRRGVMDHGTRVRRSFITADTTTANLSETSLSLFDTQNPDSPTELGRIDLAPNYSDLLIFGDHAIRVKSNNAYYYYYEENAVAKGEIISTGQHPDEAEPVSTIDIPANANLFKVGERLVLLASRWIDSTFGNKRETEVQVFDLSNPKTPKKVGELTTQDIESGYYGPYYGGYWYGGYNNSSVQVVGQSLVVPQFEAQEKLLGQEHSCSKRPVNAYQQSQDCFDNEDGPKEGCKYNTGSINCSSLNNEPEYCTGSIMECTIVKDASPDCVEVSPASIQIEESCWDHQKYRRWSSYVFHIIDLSDSGIPKLAKSLEMPNSEEAAGLLAKGSSLYVNYKKPLNIENDVKPYVRYYFKKIDLSTPSSPSIGNPINIPGIILHVDGSTIYTGDLVYGQEIIETAVNKLDVDEEKAILRGRTRFENREVESLIQDDKGHILIIHREPYSYSPWADSCFGGDVYYDCGGGYQVDQKDTLAIIDAAGTDLNIISEFDIDTYAGLKEVRDNKALFDVPGGILIVNIGNPQSPFAQAYYPLNGWIRRFIVNDDTIIIPAGNYGIYQFDLDGFNLRNL